MYSTKEATTAASAEDNSFARINETNSFARGTEEREGSSRDVCGLVSSQTNYV